MSETIFVTTDQVATNTVTWQSVSFSPFGNGDVQGVTFDATQGSSDVVFHAPDGTADQITTNGRIWCFGVGPFPQLTHPVTWTLTVPDGYVPADPPPPEPASETWVSIGTIAMPAARHYGNETPTVVPDSVVGDLFIDESTGTYYTRTS
jgi:hypothetical protein